MIENMEINKIGIKIDAKTGIFPLFPRELNIKLM